MPQCLPCLGHEIKELLTTHYPELASQIKKIADCPEASSLVLCRGKGKRADGEKRAASPYNTFIGQCLKAQGPMDFKARGQAMRKCAAEWKGQQGK